MNARDTSLVIADTSSGAEALAKKAKRAKVVSAFGTVPSEVLFDVFEAKRRTRRRPSLLYCGNNDEAKNVVAQLIRDVGFEPVDATGVAAQMARQTRQAIVEADLVIFVVDARQGITPRDQDIANELRRSARLVRVAVNKSEGLSQAIASADFHSLGLGDPSAVSAAHGEGVGEENGRSKVNRQLALEALGIKRVDAVCLEDRSIVDEQSQRAERLGRLRGQSAGSVEIGEIGCHDRGATALAADVVGELFGDVYRVSAMDGDGEAVFREVLDDRPADSPCAARDQRYAFFIRHFACRFCESMVLRR